jgi:hypothetical protein
VHVIRVRTLGMTVPHQTCEVTRRPAVGGGATSRASGSDTTDTPVGARRGAARTSRFGRADRDDDSAAASAPKPEKGTRDSIVVLVMSSDGRHRVTAPQALSLWLNGVWQGSVPGDDDGLRTSRLVPQSDTVLAFGDALVASAAVATWAGGTAMVQTEHQQVCSVAIPAAEPEKDDADAALTFRFGPEYTSANNFAADKRLAATVGVRWDIGSAAWSPTKRQLQIGTTITGTFDYTSAVGAREYGSCTGRAVDRTGGNATPLPSRIVCGPAVPFAIPRPGAPLGTVDTVQAIPFLRSDSVRAQAVPTWRGFITTRFELMDSAGYRVGPIAGIGLQTDPRGLRAAGFTNTNRPLRPQWHLGGGFRRVTSAGVEVFALDVMYGSVQNYYESDVVLVPRAVGKPDSILKIGPDPLTIAYRPQLQTAARLRLFKGASLRAYATFNAPQDGIPLDAVISGTVAPRARGFPDIVRVAFLLDRDIKKVWDTLVGTEGAKEGGGTDKSGANAKAGDAKAGS